MHLPSLYDMFMYIPSTLWSLNMSYNPFFLFFNSLLQHLLADTGYTTKTSLKSWLPEESHVPQIALASYPRSGNSLLRHLLEELTGVYTGCDTRPDRSLSLQLQACGLAGEGVVDDRVQFIKTHYPERHGWKPFKASKVILIVRNPWDAMDSYFNMMLTKSHTEGLAESQYVRFSHRWDSFCKSEINVWMKFHKYWTRDTLTVPIMVVRYEDLMMHRDETMRRIVMFISDLKDLKGTEWETKLNALKVKTKKVARPYTPRSGKIAKSFKRYSDSQFGDIVEAAQGPLKGFGYHPSQRFPHVIELPRRQVKHPKDFLKVENVGKESSEANVVVINGDNCQIRKPEDPFGRLSSRFRKALLEPVVSAKGVPLNVEEVEKARERLEAKILEREKAE